MSPVNGSASAAKLVDTLGLARQGIDRGLASFAAAARAVAADGVQGESTARHAADAVAARDQVAFAARLMTTADQMLGTLLDVRA